MKRKKKKKSGREVEEGRGVKQVKGGKGVKGVKLMGKVEVTKETVKMGKERNEQFPNFAQRKE